MTFSFRRAGQLLAAAALFAAAWLLFAHFAEQRERRVQLLWHRTEESLLRASADPYLRIELVPDVHRSIDGIGYTINQLGCRDASRDLNRYQQRLRVLLFGDATGFGWGVPQDGLVSAELERMLNRGGRELCETLNFSVPGRTIVQDAYLLLTQGYQFSPDVIVFLTTAPELIAAQKQLEELKEQGRPESEPPLTRSARQLCREAEPEALRPLFAALQQEAEQRNYRMALALLPPRESATSQSCDEKIAQYQALAREFGIHPVDLLTPMRRHARELERSQPRLPWQSTAVWQAFLADTLWKDLCAAHVLPRPLELIDQAGFEGLEFETGK